jgi:dUTPase
MSGLLYFAQTHPSPDGKTLLPSRATNGSVGLDLYMVGEVNIEPGETASIDHKVTFRFPPQVFGLLQLRPNASKLAISIRSGVIGNLMKTKWTKKKITTETCYRQ